MVPSQPTSRIRGFLRPLDVRDEGIDRPGLDAAITHRADLTVLYAEPTGGSADDGVRVGTARIF